MILKTISYNIFNRWTNAVGYEGQEKRAQRIPYLLNKIDKSIDIVCIQEAWCPDDTLYFNIMCGNNNSRSILTKEMEKYGWIYNTSILEGKPNIVTMNCFTNGGLIIYSKLPLIEIKKINFNHSCNIDKFACKGFIYIRIKKQNLYINIINTHLQANNGPEDKKIRVLQLKQILDFSNKLNKNEPLLLLGDFNINYKSKEYYNMIKILNTSLLSKNVNSSKYSSDPKTNILVGKDGEAETHKCYDKYIDNMNELCKCCHPQTLDYIMYKNNHLQPNKTEYKIIPLKTNQYNIPITNCTNIYQCLTRNPFTINLQDISDHYPVFGKFIFTTKKTQKKKMKNKSRNRNIE